MRKFSIEIKNDCLYETYFLSGDFSESSESIFFCPFSSFTKDGSSVKHRLPDIAIPAILDKHRPEIVKKIKEYLA